MSLYGAQVYSAFAEHVRGGAVEFDPQFRRCGYLYQVHGAEGIATLEAGAKMQREAGVEVQILGADELAPSLSVLSVRRASTAVHCRRRTGKSIPMRR